MTFATLEAMLEQACAQVGLSSDGAELIRHGENALYRLPEQVVVRIARSGQIEAAKKEVSVSRWLASVGINAVEAVEEIEQPIVVDGLPITFWWELPAHRHGNYVEVAAALKKLHDAPTPGDVDLAPLAPFVRLSERIDGATTLSEDDRSWLRRRLAQLQEAYAELPLGRPRCVIHGDAWAGNVVVTEAGDAVFLDLERCSVGPPEWDLVSTAVRYSTFGTLSAAEYEEFAQVYEYDVMRWTGFEILRDVRELRVTCYAVQRASEDDRFRNEAALRVASLRGLRGSRPWRDWKPLT